MEPVRFWAAVRFTAQNGGTDALLTAAAQAGLHPYRVVPLPGGFEAHCAAWQYRRFAALARKNRVRLRLQKKQLPFFRWTEPSSSTEVTCEKLISRPRPLM